ncbi:MAG: AtpZ/AtpI family protein [Micavibrio aeruginosavorus]|nr:AtpZ/AtpI family protein [Micavibrio aeruginosavorus]
MSDNDHDRLKRLSDQIDQIREKEAAEHDKSSEKLNEASNMSLGARAGAELVTCILAGGFIGWLLDGQFGTKPLFLIVFLLTGICTGFYEVYRITNNMGQAVGYAGQKKRGKS